MSPALQRVKDAVSVMPVGAGRQQGPGTSGQSGLVSDQGGVSYERDGSDKGGVAHTGVVMVEEGPNGGEDRRARVPERTRRRVLLEVPGTVKGFLSATHPSSAS
ncbi:hypothetical protein ACWDPF_24455 [Streptomyces albogriseolus]